ncbi:hypothetical protein B7463_g5134, partial [Scytalidium lignicola]
MNQDLKTSTPVDNNNKQQPEEGFEESSEEESEEESEEVSEESSKDNSEEDQEEVVILPKQFTKSTERLTVRESLKALRKKLALLLPKLNPEPVQVLRAPSPDLDPNSKLEDNVEQVLMATLKKVKITKPDLFYEDKKKLKFVVNKLNALIDLAIKIRNKQYKMILDKKSRSYFNRKKSNNKKDYNNLIKLNTIRKGKTFKGKGKKYYKGKSKKGNSFRISSEELDKRRKNKLYFKYRLFGHIANTYKKDNKSSVTIKVEVIRILKIMNILFSEEESSDKEGNSSEEEEE